MNPVQPKIRTDLVVEPVAARATPREGASFREALGRSASTLVRGAEAAMYKLPGTSVLAGAVRPGVAGAAGASGAPGQMAATPGVTGLTGGAPAGGMTAAEGPGASGSEAAPVEQALSSSQDMNLYYLELQERMATENRIFTAQSNVLKARHDTVKNRATSEAAPSRSAPRARRPRRRRASRRRGQARRAAPRAWPVRRRPSRCAGARGRSISTSTCA
jgi:hypothetical protein